MNVPKYRRWSPGAIDCYNRGCVCNGCLTGKIMEQRCRMKSAVIELVKTLGPPKIYTTNFIPGATEQEENIVRAIVEGASDLKQIAENLELNEITIKPRLYSLYRLIEDQGYQFKTRKNRLPEFIAYVKTLQPNDDIHAPSITLDEETELKGNSIMYDEDLKLEYANYLAPIIDAIKKGYERPIDIEKQTGIPQTSISAALNQFTHRLEKLGYVTLHKEISSRQTVINFIQSRLLDPEYKEEIKTEQLSDNDKSKEKIAIDFQFDLTEPYTEREAEIIDLLLNGLNYNQIAQKLVVSITTVKTHIKSIFSKRNYKSLQELLVSEFKQRAENTENNSNNTELMAENEQLRKRIEELENQTQTVVKCDLSSFKEKINQDITTLPQKLKLIEELEKDMSL